MEFLSRREPIRPAYREPAARLAALDDQGLAGLPAVPDPGHDLRGAPVPRPRGRLPHVPGVQPLAGSRTGPSTWRAASSPPPTSPWPTRPGPPRSWPGPSTSGARTVVMRPARARHRRRAEESLRPDVRRFLGAGQRGRASPWWSTPPTAGSRRTGTRWTASPPPSSGGCKPSDPLLRHRAGHPRLPPHPHLREPLRTVPQPPDRLGGERCRVPPRADQEDPVDRQQDARLLEARPGRDACGVTCGSTRSGRTTSSRWPSAWDRSGCIFGSDWPHIEALPHPLDYLVELKNFDAEERRLILNDNVSELITLRPS